MKLLILASLSLSNAWAKTTKPHKPAVSALSPTAVSQASNVPEVPPVFAPIETPLTLPMILDHFEEIDKRLKTLSADFQQFVRLDESGANQSVEGSLQFCKPDLLRLEQRLPESQLIVSDGFWLWVWRKSTNQVIQTGLQEWKKSEPLAQGLMDFGNYASLLKNYEVAIATISGPTPEKYRKVELLLTPKDKKGDFTLRLRFSTKDFFPGDAELHVGGIRVHSLIKNIHFNPKLSKENFQFKPPPQTELFQNLKPASGAADKNRP